MNKKIGKVTGVIISIILTLAMLGVIPKMQKKLEKMLCEKIQ